MPSRPIAVGLRFSYAFHPPGELYASVVERFASGVEIYQELAPAWCTDRKRLAGNAQNSPDWRQPCYRSWRAVWIRS